MLMQLKKQKQNLLRKVFVQDLSDMKQRAESLKGNPLALRKRKKLKRGGKDKKRKSERRHKEKRKDNQKIFYNC